MANGDITFDREKLTEGTTATPKCDDGFNLNGASSLTCAAGKWNTDIPTCVEGNKPRYKNLG